MDELLYWIWLSTCCTPDTATFPSLLKKFKTAKEVFDATPFEVSLCLHPRSADKAKIKLRDLSEAEKILAFCQKHSVGIVTYADKEYPQSLREIKTPPVLLYYRGKLPDFNRGVRIAVVGTRSLSDYGRKNAFNIARDLAIAGATVVSGMACGIDGVAMAGALSADMPTIAVIGSGIDICYPPEHLKLARNIVKNGCVLTEYAPSVAPTKFSFPQRNRIISGLCSATLVIEGSERSGALITARRAKEQGRIVYALPGNVGSVNAQATNLLIKNGAKLATKAEDIINDFMIGEGDKKLNPFKLASSTPVNVFEVLKELSISCVAPSDDIFRPSKTKREKAAAPQPQAISQADVKEKEASAEMQFDKKLLKIYKMIPIDRECSTDELVSDEFSSKEVMSALLKLEIGHFVTMLPGGRVKRNFK